MGPLPVSTHGFRYILVITDFFSKWVEAFPLVGTDSNTLAKILVDETVCRYGMPEIIHSDQGSNFVRSPTYTDYTISPTREWPSGAF